MGEYTEQFSSGKSELVQVLGQSIDSNMGSVNLSAFYVKVC